ncbi:nuclear pore complex protein [Achlya hypogyna]|uniref:Nuclear pore complex protein n=1 Tax=Achlya hypogyna TaxID=1202772 RepID=A0A1V9YX63_ACHHY|nr:nuclear pore complex protein [Achlya hypogyna]
MAGVVGPAAPSAADALLVVDVGTLRGHELQKEVSLLLLPQVDWSADFASTFDGAKELLVSPLQFITGNVPVPADRTLLQKGSISVRSDADSTPSTVPVIPAIQQQIIEMSDELHVSEVSCLKYWILASDPDNRAFVTHRNRLPATLLRDNVPRAAREFLLTETNAVLSSLFELLRARIEPSIAADKKDAIVEYTNTLLQKDLLGNLCRALTDDIPTLLKNKTMRAMAMVWQKTIAECIFVLAASTVVLPAELKQLVTLCQAIGTRCHATSTSVATALQGALGLSTEESPYDAKEVACQLHSLSYAHAALASTLQSHGSRLHRQSGELAAAGHAWTAEPSVTQEILKLLQVPSSCKFHGVLFLVGAVALAQYQTRLSFVQEADVTALHDAGLKHSGLTQLAQLVLPFAPESTALLRSYEAVFEDLFSAYVARLFPAHKTTSLTPRAAIVAPPVLGAQLAPAADSLTQLLELGIALSRLDPSFAMGFWTAQQPFLTAAASLAQATNPSRLAYMALLAACAPGRPELAYKHIKESPPPVTWKHFFAAIDNYRRVLMHEPTAAGAPAATTPAHRFQPAEVQALAAMFELFRAVLDNRAIVHLFLDWPDNNVLLLFLSFLRCSIPSVLKGAVMHTLARFVVSAPLAQLLWQHLEAAQVLATTATPSTTSIQFELEQIESMQRAYPATTGFLALLRPLFQHDFPEECGAGYRVSGNRPYLDFVIDHVFLKLPTREFDSETEKWTLLEHVLGLFHDVLQRYEPAPSDFVDEYVALTTANGTQHVLKPKPSGWFLLSKLLTDSPLLRQLLVLLPTVDELERGYEAQHAAYATDLCMQLVQPEDAVRPWNALAKRQDCVLLVLDTLVLAMRKEAAFLALLRESQLPERMAEPLTNLLARTPAHIVKLTKYVRYPDRAIAALALQLLALLSQNLPAPARLVEIFVDAGAATDMVDGVVAALMDPASALREPVLDLLLATVGQPAPNLATFFLGWPPAATPGASALDAIVLFLDNAALVQSAPTLAEKCYRLVHALLAAPATRPVALQRLGHPTLNCFLFRQAQLLPHLVPAAPTSPESHRAQLALVQGRQWLLESLALWLFHAKCPEVATWFWTPAPAVPLLALLDGTPLALTPPARPADAHSLALAEQCSVEKDAQLLIDIPAFSALLERNDTLTWRPADARDKAAGAAAVLQWALGWNRYSERVAAEAKALAAWRKLVEVAVLQYAPPVAALHRLLDAVLGALQAPGLVAHLAELAAAAAIGVSFQLRGATAGAALSAPQRALLLERTAAAVQRTQQSTGNPAAARRARSSLYACYLHVLRYAESARRAVPAVGQLERLAPAAPAVGADAAFVALVVRDATDVAVPLTMGLAATVLESLPVGSVLPALQPQLPHLCGVLGQERPAVVRPSVLSLWTHLASSKDGALALLQGGAVRALFQLALPPRPTKPLAGPLDAYLAADQAFHDQWLPVLRLLVALASALPQHAELLQLLAQAVQVHWKLVAACVQVDPEPSLNRLTELSLVTFVLRTLAAAPVLEQTLGAPKVLKLTRRLVALVPVFGLHLVRGGWWQALAPRTVSEQERSDVMVAGRWSLFAQSALYASRLALCHTLAFCRLRLVAIEPLVPLFADDAWNEWKQVLDAFKAALGLDADATCDADFHRETMLFLLEHLVAVLSLHCLHYQNGGQAKSILKLLGTDMENYAFVHVLCRKLREVCRQEP